MCFCTNNPNEEQGLKPYDSWHGGDLDSVSMTTGGLALHVPLVSFPQRGNLDLSFMVRHSTKQWYVKPAKLDQSGHIQFAMAVVNAAGGNAPISIEPGDLIMQLRGATI